MSKQLLDEVIENAPNRRSFLQKIAIASAATTTAGSLAEAQTMSAPTDADILNFALNLEYLEAEFYSIATTGQTIDKLGIGITGTGTAGATTGGAQVSFTNSTVMSGPIANQIARDERAHVSPLLVVISSC